MLIVDGLEVKIYRDIFDVGGDMKRVFLSVF